MGQIGRLAARTVIILLVAGVIVAGATAVGSSPLGARLPGTLLPLGGDQHQDPPPGVGQADPAAQPRGPQAGRVGAGASGGRQAAGGDVAGQTAPSQGLFSGRNAPSLQNGLRQELPYLAIFAGLTGSVALSLRLLQRRRRA
jgi:hypothetical protein